MSFWLSPNYSVSTVDQILDKEKYTLEELLQASEILQETQALNGRLIAYLNKPEVVSKLLDYVITPQTPEKDEKSSPGKKPAEKAFEYPAVVCEVFGCEARSIFETLLGDEKLMEKLFSILDKPENLNSVMAGYFSRVVYSLYAKRVDTHYEQSVEVIEYLEDHKEIISKLIKNLHSTAIAEVLLRFLGADESSATPVPREKLQWMLDTSYLEELVDQLSPSVSLEAQHNTAYILSGIVRGNFSPLVMHLTQRPQIISRIFEYAFKNHEPPQKDGEGGPDWKTSTCFGQLFAPLQRRRPALDVCIALLNIEPRGFNGDDGSTADHSAATTPRATPTSAGDNSAECRELALQEMQSYMQTLKDLLNGKNLNLEQQEIRTPYGSLKPPLSITRLKAVELALTILQNWEPESTQAFMTLGYFKELQRLFRQYPYHNLLHKQFTEVCLLILHIGPSELQEHVLGECRLIDWLISLPEEIPLEGSEKMGRAGYLGHVTYIANKIASLASFTPAVATALGASEGWSEWVDTKLQARNETQDSVWSCGRPNISKAPVSSVDELEVDTLGYELEDDLMKDVDDAPLPNSREGSRDTINDMAANFARVTNFTSVDLDDSLNRDSSSSDDSDDFLCRPTFNNVTTRNFTDSSDEDDDTVVVNSARMRSAGFTDFEDVGGFESSSRGAHASSASAWAAPGWSDLWSAPNALQMEDIPLSDDSPLGFEDLTHTDSSPAHTGLAAAEPETTEEDDSGPAWNAFQDSSEPTDQGWASFPDDNPGEGSQGESSKLSSAEEPSTPGKDVDQEKAGALTGQESPPEQVADSGNKEFSSFNFWRQSMSPVDEDFLNKLK